ncbi:MAG: hypothetical protein KIT56_00450 [Gammaproteobacteria bacterium]|nr:hypothetical protein [Gammaproteobacteria bacterium]MCW5582356.1 hypothetical protein [Gammaproteobacteria bacterium]
MPLTEEQKRTIEASINHLLDFPSDPLEFIQKEANIMYACTHQVNKSDEFYWIRECLINPTQHFQAITRQGPPLTIGEVQEYIVDFVTLCLKKHEKYLLIWNKDNILNSLPIENWIIDFHGQQAFVEGGENPLQLSVPAGKIYTQELRIVMEEQQIFGNESISVNKPATYVDIVVEIDEEIIHRESIKLLELPRNFRDDQDENQYIENLKQPAEEKALSVAGKTALNHLAKKFNVPAYTRRACNSRQAKEVITNKYYFNLLDKGQLHLSDLSDLLDYQANNLCNQAIISLINKDVLNFNQAKNLTSYTTLIITNPVYYRLIINGNIPIKQITNISDRRSKFLIHPNITNLIQRGKITYHQARLLPFYLKDILLSNLYLTFFTLNDINWKKFSKIREDQHQLLLNASVVRFIVNNVLNMENVVSTLEKNTDNNDALLHLAITAITFRLYGIWINNPYSINSIPDNINVLIDEIQSIADNHHIEPLQFQEWVLPRFLSYIECDLKEKITGMDKEKIHIRIYHYLMNAIPMEIDASTSSWSKTFQDLIQIAVKINRSLHAREWHEKIKPHDRMASSQNRFFSSLRKQKKTLSPDDEDLKDFCNRLTALAPFSSAISRHTSSLNFT